MISFYEISPKLPRFGLRMALTRVHRDLFTVHRKVDRSARYFPSELSNLEKLVILLEDRRFLTHAGVDAKSVARELVLAVLFKKHGGASTIDMQFVRTATGFKEHTLFRKVYEIMISVLIQYRYDKITILRSYLGCAFFGTGLIGSGKAAQRMYNVHPEDLSIEQSAVLASLLVYPRPRQSSSLWEGRVRRRASYGVALYVRHKQSFDQFPV
jgi:membrane peptidoglycan carboxypeptidase